MASRGPIPDLWTARDDADLARFLEAAGAEQLVPALHALEGVSAPVAREDESLLDGWAARVALRLPSTGPGLRQGQARALAEVLGEELGFRGESTDYHHPRNSLLHHVLSRRRGLPILLSALWIDVGRRAGIPVDGVGLPGHYVVRVGGSSGVLCDPFEAGVPLTKEECRRKVRSATGGRLSWRDEFLQAQAVPQLLERVLVNLLVAYRRERDARGEYRTATFLAALLPDSAERQLQRAEIADQIGARELAAAAYAEIVDRFPESTEAETAATRLDAPLPGTPVN